MNHLFAADAAEPTQYTEFVWRRLEEPLRAFNYDLPWQVWLVVLGLVLATAFFYVAWMYVKDSHGVGPWWATLLGLLRSTVYVILALVFLLPSNQTKIQTRSESKVLVVFDVSGSMHTSDELAEGRSADRLPTRQDKVVAFLVDPKVAFLPALEKKNPTTLWRIGSKLDDEFIHLAGGRSLTRTEKDKPDVDKEGAPVRTELKGVSEDALRVWLNPAAPVNVPPDLAEAEKKRLEKLSDANQVALKEGLTRGTNLGDNLLALLNKELSNRVQGIVVFTDGRNNEGSPRAFQELEARAKATRIPIFVVGVGEDRQKVKIELADPRVPQQVQPEDRFRVVAEVSGQGLPEAKLDLTLEVTHTRKDKKDKEELLDIELVEAENKDDPKATRRKISLGKKLVLKPAAEVKLDKGNPPNPPRAEAEFQLDAAALAAAKNIDLNGEEFRGKKWELGETKEDSEWKFQVRVPVDKREGLQVKEHLSNKGEMRVIKKPVRVLLVAAGAGRDYQFVRTLLVREADKKRLELAVLLQPPPGEIKPRTGVVQDVPPERLLKSFPDTFEAKPGDLHDLSSYDVIVCFDPDWTRLTVDQIGLLRKWANKGGGLVMVGGYINTVELIRPRSGEDAGRFQPILQLLPVELADRRDYVERKTDDPWQLDFEGATPEMEFLRLDEEFDESKFKEDWKAFFYGTGKEATDRPQRGFFSFYPVERAKTGSIVVARFADPVAKLKDGTLHPYIVMNPDTSERVIWIGSAETWRLREYREEYHERFWTKLVRYAASKSQGKAHKRIQLEMGKLFTANKFVDVEAKLYGSGGDALDRSAKPQLSLLKTPVGVNQKDLRLPVTLVPRSGAHDGWFTGRFQVRVPGDYELQLTVPETNDVETRKFTVKEANPELDDTRPDYDRMYRLASEAEEVFLRMPEGDRQLLKKRLQRPKLSAAGGAEAEKGRTEIREDKQRLYFDLKNAELIPGCMIQDVQTQESKGPVNDLWDDGVALWTYDPPGDPNLPAKQPVKVSYVLLTVVGLLSVEWLIRKLLRLA
jgi:hypothetical protein